MKFNVYIRFELIVGTLAIKYERIKISYVSGIRLYQREFLFCFQVNVLCNSCRVAGTIYQSRYLNMSIHMMVPWGLILH